MILDHKKILLLGLFLLGLGMPLLVHRTSLVDGKNSKLLQLKHKIFILQQKKQSLEKKLEQQKKQSLEKKLEQQKKQSLEKKHHLTPLLQLPQKKYRKAPYPAPSFGDLCLFLELTATQRKAMKKYFYSPMFTTVSTIKHDLKVRESIESILSAKQKILYLQYLKNFHQRY